MIKAFHNLLLYDGILWPFGIQTKLVFDILIFKAVQTKIVFGHFNIQGRLQHFDNLSPSFDLFDNLRPFLFYLL